MFKLLLKINLAYNKLIISVFFPEKKKKKSKHHLLKSFLSILSNIYLSSYTACCPHGHFRHAGAVEQDKVENFLKRNDKSKIVQGIKDDRLNSEVEFKVRLKTSGSRV